MPAPTFVTHGAGESWDTSTSPKTTPGFATNNGDLVVSLLCEENDDNNENYSWASSVAETWTEHAESPGGLNDDVWIQSARTQCTSAWAAGTVSASRAAGTVNRYNHNSSVWRSHGGVGNVANSAQIITGTSVSYSFTTAAADSALLVIMGDWNALPHASRAYTAINGGTPVELAYFHNNAAYTLMAFYHPNVGAAGAKTIQVTGLHANAPKWRMHVVEIKGGATTTTVAASRATTWHTKARVTPTRATTWHTKATLAASRQTTWDIRTSTAATRATTWRVQASTASTRATTWHVRATVTPTRSTTWNVRTTVAGSRATTWNTKATVAASRATTWNVAGGLATVTASRATTWNVKATVTPTRATTWRVLASVAPTRSTTWNVRTTVSTTRATTWNVLSSLATVGASRATSWHTKARVTPSRVTSWNTKATLPTSRSTTWDVRTNTAASRATTWDVLTTVAPVTRATTWRVRSTVSGSRATTWNVLRTSVSTSRSTTWRVLAQVTPTRSTTWAVQVIIVPKYRFSPPTHQEPIRTRIAPLRYFTVTHAKSIIKNGAVYTRVSVLVPEDLVGKVDGVDYWRGGCVYELDQAVADSLATAGYPSTQI